jgi:predicted dehydrogenase
MVHANSLVNHVPAGKLVGIVDPIREVLSATADQFGVDARFESLEAALDWGEFEAVAITTPTFIHRDLAVMAAEAGKHVFLEKPMAITLEECDEIIEAVQRNGVFLQLGFMRRFAPEFEAAAKRIEVGEISRPMLIKSFIAFRQIPFQRWGASGTKSFLEERPVYLREVFEGEI